VHLAGVIKEVFESKYALKEPDLLFKKSRVNSLHIIQGFRKLLHAVNIATTVIRGN
jgi:hypothetical protein